MLHPYRKAGEAIRVFGFPKFATHYLRHIGDANAPESWDLPSVARYLGETIGEDLAKEAELSLGFKDLREICGDEKIAEAESFTPDFHAVKVLVEAQEKTASAGYRERVASEQRGLWERMKAAAERTSDPTTSLAGEALRVWSETERTGTKTAASREEREGAARSFASNYVVDAKIAKLLADGEITAREAEKLATLSAEAAISDLMYLTRSSGETKTAAPLYMDPRVIGAGIGAVGGAGIGAWDDKDNRLRGAAMGGLLGMPLGVVGGQVVKEIMDHRATSAAQALEELKGKAATRAALEEKYEALRRAAEDMGMFAHARNVVDNHRDQILSHWEAGNKDLPLDFIGSGFSKSYPTGSGQSTSTRRMDPQELDQLATRFKDYQRDLL